MKAQNKIQTVKIITPNHLNVLDLLKHDKLFLCPESLREIQKLIIASSFQSEKPKWVRNNEIEEFLNINFQEKDKPQYAELDENEPLDLQFTFLKDYYEVYLESIKQSKEEPLDNINEEASPIPEGN